MDINEFVKRGQSAHDAVNKILKKQDAMSPPTPGPWKAVPPDDQCKDWFITNGSDNPDKFYIARLCPDLSSTPNRSERDAKLIAHAPTLVEMLRELEGQCFDLGLSRLREDQRDACAIACKKARALLAQLEEG